MYKRIAALWKRPKDSLGELWKQRLVKWRKEGTVTRVDRPTRIDRARALGYRSKQGIVVARVRVKRGRRKRPKPTGGRRPKTSGRFFPLDRSKQSVAEQKASKKFPNLEVLNSYWVAEDGQHRWFECIMADPNHPSIKKDRNLKWLQTDKHKGRAERGLTSAGKKGRGLNKKGKGSEKTRQRTR
jgi:large subunit ribosomal protein L15e